MGRDGGEGRPSDAGGEVQTQGEAYCYYRYEPQWLPHRNGERIVTVKWGT